MTTRPKNLLTYFLICLTPLLLLAGIGYWNGIANVDRVLGATAENNLNALTSEVDRRLQDDEAELTRLSLSPNLQQFVNASRTTSNAEPVAPTTGDSNSSASLDGSQLSSELRNEVASLVNSHVHFVSLSLVGVSGGELFRAQRMANESETKVMVYRDGQLPEATGAKDAMMTRERSANLEGSSLRFSVPVYREGSQAVSGMLVGDLDLPEFFADVASILETKRTTRGAVDRSAVIVLDNSGKIIYHTDHVLEGQLASQAIPEFGPMAAKATSNQSGTEICRAPDGQEYLTAFAPLPRLKIAVAVVRDRSRVTEAARRWGGIGFLVAGVLALIAAFLLMRYDERKSRSIERVTEDLNAIAKGELDRRIELRSSDEARPIADNINVVTERLRTQIAREAESRQFASFLRLSAMLTHDLKNAIEALSLTVGNMEQHFDNEQFRIDAMKSVTGATEKLKTVVARLTRPLTSLSGEHKRPTKVDLIPVIKRVVDLTARPVEDKYKIEMKLQPVLYALVDNERIEAVIENLVLNAIEAMADKNGVLTVEAGKAGSGEVFFSVTDTGPGISPSFIQHRLFRPFTTTKPKGVGLGLYTCRDIVQANGGSIEVESREGAGTTFRVVLPSVQINGRD